MNDAEADAFIAKILTKLESDRSTRRTRAEKKQEADLRKAARKALVRFAGHHRTRSGTPEQVQAVIWPAKIWRFERPLPVPRSLRFALGSALSVPEPPSWKRMLGSAAWAYMTPTHSATETSPP